MNTVRSFFADQLLAFRQRRLLETLWCVGDILSYEAGRMNRTDIVTDGLEELRGTISSLLELRRANPAKFHALLVSQEFRSMAASDPDNAGVILSLRPKESLVLLESTVSQIIRIFRGALKSKNDAITRKASVVLIGILGQMCEEEGNEELVNLILSHLSDLRQEAITARDSSMYSSAIHWYGSIVFKAGDERGCKSEYLPKLDGHFLWTMKDIVDGSDRVLFNAIVANYTYSMQQDWPVEEIWALGHLPLSKLGVTAYQSIDKSYDIERQLKELSSRRALFLQRHVPGDYQRMLSQFSNLIKNVLPKGQEAEVEALSDGILADVEEHYRDWNLRALIFMVGAYCVFKGRYGFLRELWEFHNPKDADISLINRALVPETWQEAFRLFLWMSLWEREGIREGQHGTRRYHMRYFAILLLRVFARSQSGNANMEQGKLVANLQEEKLSVNLEEYDADRLYWLQQHYKEISDEIDEIVRETDLVAAIYPGSVQLPVGVVDACKNMIAGLAANASKRIQGILRVATISSEKLEEFGKEVIGGFKEEAILRAILSDIGCYEEKLDDPGMGPAGSWGINQVENKAPYLAQWYASYSGIGESYGRSLGRGENSDIAGRIVGPAKSTCGADIDHILGESHADAECILLTHPLVVHDWAFGGNQQYRPRWVERDAGKYPKYVAGWYEYRGTRITVAEVFADILKNRVLILRRGMTGKMVQYSPYTDERDRSYAKGPLLIKVVAYSEDAELLKKTLEKPPKWLLEKGDSEEMKAHLERSVLVQILERFEYIVGSKGFEPRVWDISSKPEDTAGQGGMDL